MLGKKSSSAGKKKSVKQGPQVNFFAAHAEKLALGLVVAVLGYLVYEGIGGKSYDKARQPDQLGSDADKLLQTIRNGDPWPQLVAERTIPTGIEARTKDARQPTNPEDYPSSPLSPGSGTSAYALRSKPELKAPVKVMGQSVVGLIAVVADDNYVDPFEEFEDAEKLKGARRAPTRGGNRGGMMGEGGGAGMGMGPGMGPGEGGMGTMDQKRYFPSQYNKGYSIFGTAGGMGGMGGMGGEGGMMGGGMMGGGGMPGGPGMGPGGGMAPGAGGVPGTGTTTGTTITGGVAVRQKKYKAEPIFFNAVTALVEHEEMVKDFETKLRQSASFYPMRDRPIYLSFEVERAEVRGNQPLKWEGRTTASQQLAMMKTWLPPKPQTIPEVIDPSSYDRALTMPIPPIMVHDYRRFAKHPDIDWVWDAGLAAINMMRQNEARTSEVLKAAEEAQESMYPGERPGGMGMGGGMPGMGGGMGMEGGMGMAGGMPGMGGGMGMEGGMGMAGGMPGMGGGMGMEGGMGMAGGMPGMGMGMDGGMGMAGGMPGGMGMEGGGYGGGMGMGSMGMQMPKFKMVRFYDRLTPADVGRTYKYRVRLIMENPNYPSDYYPSPRPSDLDREVWVEVAALRRKEDPEAEKVAKYNRERKPNRQGILPPAKVFQREKLKTPWSDESNGIYVRGTDDIYMGKPKKAGEVEAVLVRLDVSKGAYVPLYSFATEDKPAAKIPLFKRGAIIAMDELTTHFAHPVTNLMKVWEKFSFKAAWNANTVIDIRGNDPLALSNTKDDPLTDNTEMMMMMSDGRVEVTNEYDDAFWYRAFTVADERERAENPNTGMYGGAGGDGGGMPGGGMMGGGKSG